MILNRTVSLLITLGLMLAVSACESAGTRGDNSSMNASLKGDYQQILDRWTQTAGVYRSLVETLQVTATMISQDVGDAQLEKMNDQFHWTADQFKENRDKAATEMQTQTKFFVGAYTDQSEDNNLDKEKSDWNIFLNLDGRRVNPTQVKRLYDNAATLQAKYPYVNVWNRYYMVTFPVGTYEAQGGHPELVIAGAVGSVKLKFPKE
jgi:hypothetical protein